MRSRSETGDAPALLVDLGLHQPRQIAQGVLPAEIAGLDGNDVRNAGLGDLHLGADIDGGLERKAVFFAKQELDAVVDIGQRDAAIGSF